MPYEGAKDGKHYWLTPPDLFAELDAEFNFDFDPCPYPKPDDFDGLEVEWGKSNYVNPPFKGPTKWARKAIKEYHKGKKVVFVFPIDKWIHMLLEAGAEVRNLKDIRWCAIEDGQPGKGTGRWIAAFVLDPELERADMPAPYSASIAAAWELVEELKQESPFGLFIKFCDILAEMLDANQDDHNVDVFNILAGLSPETITRAYLLAKLGEYWRLRKETR